RCHHEVGPRLVRRPEAVALDQPLLVVPALELPKILDEFGDRGEVSDPKPVLLDGSDIRHHSARAFFGPLTVDRLQFVPSASSAPAGQSSACSGPHPRADDATASARRRPPTRSSARTRRGAGGHAASPTNATGGRRSG